ncbi:hypothetical protein [Pleionea sp. CnH1-48]|uniref:hypothetical protein n=1 Tax=Pleionea sp. CnH1-48 TaxID=2954494 RepID=UPI002096DD0C|nr:hypothetical protein [Pleionea sp. CnH1-48]MCO7224881.1 hypothetical protein [Pleionea sp. CnH1-48]
MQITNSIPNSTMLGGMDNGLVGNSPMSWASAPLVTGLSNLSGVVTYSSVLYTGGAMLGTGLVFAGGNYLSGVMSSDSVEAPSTDQQQIDASQRMNNLTTTDGTELDSLKAVFDHPTIENGEDLVGTIKDHDEETISDHISDNLDSYAMRGAHIVKSDDNGQLFTDMINELTGEDFDDVDDVLENLTQNDLPDGMVERNTKWWNGSSHYKNGSDGHFNGIRQFGVDIEGGGHLLFGVRENDQGHKETWFQFEGHGVSDWGEFALHGGDFFRHKGSGNGQVGPSGYCGFTEKPDENGNTKEIIVE